MAIGDTVNAGLMRVDFSPIQRAGEAQARANQAFGQTIGNVLDKFYEKKREKAQQESIADTLVSTFGVNREEANHLSKNKEFIPTFFEQQKAQRDYQLQLDKFNLEEEKYKQALERQEKSDLLADKAREKEEAQAQIYDQFLGSREMVDMQLGRTDTNPLMRNVPGPTTQVPQGEYKGNRFFQTEQGKSDFTSLVDAGMDESDALEMASKREAQFLASQPKAMSDKDKIDLKNKQETTRQLFDKPLIDLGDKFDKNKQVQEYKAVVVSYDTISLAAENPSAAGDLSLIFQYMKVLDPGSTVREGEFANAQNAAGVPARIRNLFNNWAEGQRLNDDQRQDFVKQAKKIVDARRKSIDPIIKQTRQKFDRQIKSQKRNLSTDEADLLFQEVIFPDMKSSNNEKNQNTSPQITAPQSVNLNSGGIFTPVQ